MTQTELRQIVDTTPTPVDATFGMCRAYVETESGSWRVVFAREGGRVSEPVGPKLPLTREGGRTARALVSLFNERLR